MRLTKEYSKECKTTLLLEEIIVAEPDVIYMIDGEKHSVLSVALNPAGGIRVHMDPAWEAIIDQVVDDHDKSKKDKNEKLKDKKDKDLKDAEKKLKDLGFTPDEVAAITGG